MFNSLTPVVKNLIILNVGMFIITSLSSSVMSHLILYSPILPQFSPYQILTNMFLHAGFGHVFFNMLWLFFMGPNVEHLLGDKKFLTFYMVCGLGATVLYMLSQYLLFGNPPYMLLGASGAVSGIMIATAVFFPNSTIVLFPLPIPIKMKYFVLGYAAYELIQGLTNSREDNVAHFAHLGGMVIGYVLIKFWDFRPTRGNW